MTTDLRCAPALLALVIFGACEPVDASTKEAPARARIVARVPLDLGHVVGISGMTADASGTLWAVPERERFLVSLHPSEPKPFAAMRLVGVPEGLDTESIAWMNGEEFAVGTESQVSGRKRDLVLLVRREGNEARVFDRIAVPYDEFGLRPRGNQGLEALCVKDGTIVVGLESVTSARIAHVFRASLVERIWEPFRLKLTTHTGKLSAFDCRREGDELVVVAIERHFGVARILSFRLPLRGKGGDVAPVLLADLVPLFRDVPNMEGIVWRRSGELVIVTDNHNSVVVGPTEVITIAVLEGG